MRQNLKNRPFMFLYASSLEAPTVLQEYGALPITVSFPTMNRLILNRTYAGFVMFVYYLFRDDTTRYIN